MINIVTGKPGEGKTTYLAKLVQQFLKEGVTVWSYEKCKFNDPRVHYFKEISEIRHLRNAVIILDEAQMWFNSRKWDTLDDALQYALQQHRHKGVDIWGAVQNINRLDTVMRELVGQYYEVRQVFGTKIRRGKMPKNPWGVFSIRKYDPLDANLKKPKLLGFRLFCAGKKLFDFYDTQADFDFKEEENFCWVKQFTCPTCHHKKIQFGKGRPINPPVSERIPNTNELPF